MGISSISNTDWSIYLQQYAATKASQNATVASQTDSTGISRNSGTLSNVVATSADGDTFQLSPEAVSAADMFSKMDADSDGSLSQSEFISSRPGDVTEEMAKNLYNSFDSDTSGSLSEAEYTTAMNNAPPPPPNAAANTSSSTDSQSFDSLDTNKDGVVSMDELLAARPDDVSEEMAAQLFSTLDTDQSGDLSSTELANMSKNAAASGVSAV